MSNARIQSAPRTAMELAWLKAAQRLATQKPKQKPQPAQQPQGKQK